MQQNFQLIVVDAAQYQSLLDKIEFICQQIAKSPPQQQEITLLTTKEAAKKLKVCSKTIINKIESGELKAIKYNKGQGKRGHYKLPISEIDKFIKNKRLGY